MNPSSRWKVPQRLAGCALAWAALLGGPAEGVEPGAAPPAKLPRLTVRVEVERDGVVQSVAAGDRLRSGDRLQVFASVDHDLYLYLVQFFADGSAAVLHPEKEDLLLRAGYALRLPAAGQWFQLDDVVGEENLYFVASDRPLAEVDTVVAARLREVRTSPGAGTTLAEAARPRTEGKADAAAPQTPSRPPAPKRPPPAVAAATGDEAPADSASGPPPGGFGFAERGLVRVAGREGTVVEIDEEGLAIYRFRFEHVGR